ncbi:DUF2267 domain-containing protein [Candidatus Parcubacteria bacterium]|nr:MAG: DUF2267 domain-containing protein [Candidatus Parcubacteria bacterium]
MASQDPFASTIQKSNQFLREIESEMGWEDRKAQAYAALRIVLQTLRDRLTVEEAADFGAQLPQLIRGIYYEGWKPSAVPKKISKEQFINIVQENFFYSVELTTPELIKRVFRVFERYVSEGEIKDVKAELPKKLKDLF